MTIQSHAQHGEDLRIRELIDPNAACYGVDVGANDGQSWSNSYLFGLNGYNLLLIEPMPVYAERCRNLYDGNDFVIVEEAAVSPDEGEVTFYLNDDKQQDELAMRSSLLRDVIPSSDVSVIQVRAVPLYRLLVEHDWPRYYAFLSVDAEGYDLEVLRTARFNQFRPSVICVEEGENHPTIKLYLEQSGYRFDSTLGPNGIYVSDRKPHEVR